MSKALGVAEALLGAGCLGLGALALPSVAGSVPLFALGALLVRNAHSALK